MRAIAFRPRFNTDGKKDVTGAFQPEAEQFVFLHGGNAGAIHVIDNSRPMVERAAQVLAVLDNYRGAGLDAIAFFCHGWPDGIQLGFRRSNVHRLGEAIAATAAFGGVTVPLYVCSSGAPDDNGKSFAGMLRDSLFYHGVPGRVLAHTTKGHTTYNPYVVTFEGTDAGRRIVGVSVAREP